MRKTVALLVCAASALGISFGLCGCGGKTEDTRTDGDIYAVYQSYVAYAEANSQAPLSYELWLASIKGEKGNDGAAGEQGPKGEKGDQGDKGEDGKSAYQIWLDNGNSGTQNEFLAWLKGAAGDAGEKGEQGPKGDQGEKGDKGDPGENGTAGTSIVSVKQVFDKWKIATWFEFTLSDEQVIDTKATAVINIDANKTYSADSEEEYTTLTTYGVSEAKIKKTYITTNPPTPPAQYVLESPLNWSELVVIKKYGFTQNTALGGSWSLHNGYDFKAEADTETAVTASLDGKITEIVLNDATNGSYIVIQHKDGIVTKYCYVTPLEDLKVGDEVYTGDQIGVVSEATGIESSSGPHLHFEVYKDGQVVDPADYLNIPTN